MSSTLVSLLVNTKNLQKYWHIKTQKTHFKTPKCSENPKKSLKKESTTVKKNQQFTIKELHGNESPEVIVALARKNLTISSNLKCLVIYGNA